ncbi:MAG: peptide-methionine (S)-S-oxide reductase MsrA [Thermoanaerobaculia bacterium]|nr:peptide-methionine (S)-S-oxide reductase MsrA [Thermoanaerobaculia bacterium]
MKRILTLALTVLALGCAAPISTAADGEGHPASEPPAEGLSRATFAGGCFWCMEPPFDKLEGVISTTSGYTGGPEVRPTYKQVAYGRTGHTEAVEVVYDPEKISYERLLFVFWRNIDPTVRDRQFCDAGTQYRTAIFVHDVEQRRLAEESLAELQENQPFRGEIVTPVQDAEPFYPAEEYHQDFYEKNPLRYKTYRRGCRRDARLEELWGDEAGG